MTSEIDKGENAEKLQVPLNGLHCYECNQNFQDKGAFANHRHSDEETSIFATTTTSTSTSNSYKEYKIIKIEGNAMTSLAMDRTKRNNQSEDEEVGGGDSQNQSFKKIKYSIKLSELGDYFLCTKCYDVTFNKIGDLAIHFSKCQGTGGSLEKLRQSNKASMKLGKSSSTTMSTSTQTTIETKSQATQFTTKLTIEQKSPKSTPANESVFVPVLPYDSSSYDVYEQPHSPPHSPEESDSTQETRNVKIKVLFKDPFMNIDVRGGPYQCQICKKVFKNKRGLFMHGIYHKEEKQLLMCPVRPCPFRDLDQEKVAAHVRQAHPIGCMGGVREKRQKQN